MWKRVCGIIERHELLFFVLIAVLALRIPNVFEPYWYGDEGIYLTLGQSLRAGLKLYAEIIDHKTPLIYWLAALTGTLVWFRLLLICASLASVVLFYFLARRFMRSKPWGVGIATVAFALLTTLPWLEGNIANGEILLMPFILAGALVFWRGFPVSITKKTTLPQFYRSVAWWQPVAVGALFSLALLLKVPAGFDFGALGIFFLTLVPGQFRKKTFTPMLWYGMRLVVGFILPILASVAWFAFRGTLTSYFDFGLLYNFRYIEAWGTPFHNPVALFLASMKGRVLALSVFIGLVWVLRRFLSVPFRFVACWFGFTLFAALLSLRPYPHYFIQILPAATLLVGMSVSGKWAPRLITAMALLVSSGVLLALRFFPYPTVPYYENFVNYIRGALPKDQYYARFDAKTGRTYAVANWLKMRTRPHERVFLWGDEPMVYALSERIPVGRFTVMFHIASFNAWDETIQAIDREKPRFILAFHDGYTFPALEHVLNQDYVWFDAVSGVDIYRRVEY